MDFASSVLQPCAQQLLEGGSSSSKGSCCTYLPVRRVALLWGCGRVGALAALPVAQHALGRRRLAAEGHARALAGLAALVAVLPSLHAVLLRLAPPLSRMMFGGIQCLYENLIYSSFNNSNSFSKETSGILSILKF